MSAREAGAPSSSSAAARRRCDCCATHAADPPFIQDVSKPLLEIHCFGKLHLRVGGAYFPFPWKKTAEILAYLVCALGRPVSKPHLAEAIWPAAEQQQAMDCLYKACRHLKNTPFSSIISSSSGEMRLSLDGIRCDIVDFRDLYADRQDMSRCEAAVELYHGSLFADDVYEWSREWEAYYDVRYLELLTLLAARYSEAGNQAKAAYYRSRLDAHAMTGR